LSQQHELLATVSRIVNELLIVKQPEDNIVEFVSLDELVVVVKRNREAVGNNNTRQPRIHHFTEIRRLPAERQTRWRALLGQTEQPLFR
jgi:hypothetical protein